MSERGNKTGPFLAEVSVAVGTLFCVVGMLMAIVFESSGMLQGTLD